MEAVNKQGLNGIPRSIFASFVFFITSLAVQSQAIAPLTLEQIFSEYRFSASTVDGMTSLADGAHYAVLLSGYTIATYDYKTGLQEKVLLSASQFNNKFGSIDDYEISRDEKKLLLTTGKTKQYRYSFEAKYFIYDLGKKILIPLSDTGKQKLASFSPDGSKVAFVNANNLYYKDLSTQTIVQVTSDGKFNNIINGAPDWVYEEEFGISMGYCWSPDSRSIAFYRFDESGVKQFEMTVYNSLYPQTNRFRYPKAGEDNSAVEIKIFDTATKKTIPVNIGTEKDQYIPRIKWTASADKLCVIRLNRLQNQVDVLLADAREGAASVVFSEKNVRFIPEINDDYIHFTGDGKYFIVRSERSGYFQYYRFSIAGSFINPVTGGNWDTDEIFGTDDSNEVLYYSSAEASPLQRQVYAVRYDGTGKKKLSAEPGIHSVDFSASFNYYVDTWSDANTPPRVSVHRSDGILLRVLEDNGALRGDMKTHGFVRKDFITIPVDEGIELNAYLVKPPDFDSTRKYPLLISVYGGPESQDVTDSWDSGFPWQVYMARQGYVVACIDNRGTDGRGEDFRKSTYMQLGKLETHDQIASAVYLGCKNWIDENRIGVWGWSYGGYMTLLCMTKGAGVFKAGIAVGSVTSWRFYDSIYTERFLRTPGENPAGYDDNSPINHAASLQGKLLMIHGTADDNVHFQNTVEMADKLIKANKQFEVFYYPDKNHNIAGGNTRYHLYTMMTAFIMKNL